MSHKTTTEHPLLARMASVANFLDGAGMYEDATVIDGFIETVAKAKNPGILKEAGIWTDLLARMTGGARRLLFREYRQMYQDAKYAQKQLEKRLTELFRQAKELRRYLKLHNLQGWRKGLDDVVSEVSVPDFDALGRYDEQYNRMLQEVFKNLDPRLEHGPGTQPSTRTTPPVLPKVTPEQAERFAPVTETPHPSSGLMEGTEEEEPQRPFGETGGSAEGESVSAPNEGIDMTEEAEEIKPPKIPEDIWTSTTQPPEQKPEPEFVESEEEAKKSEKAVVEPETPEEATPEEEAEAEADTWESKIFKGVKRTSIEYPIEVNQDSTKMRLSFDQYKNYVMGINAEELPPEAKKVAGKNRPLRESHQGIMPNWGTAPDSLILFMGPYFWQSKASNKHIILIKSKSPLSWEHAPERQRKLFKKHLEQLNEVQSKASERRRNLIISLSGEQISRKSRILRFAEGSFEFEHDPDEEPSVEDIDEAAKQLLESGMGI